MSTWLVVPVRSLRDGKSRLATVLDPAQRFAFVERLLVRTLEQAAQFPGLDRTLVVSACDEARARAVACGAQALLEQPPGGLNGALRQARLAVHHRGAAQMLMVSCDLPLLQADDLRELAAAAVPGTIALAPDRARQGTNGLCMAADTDLDFAFGPNSFALHLACTRRVWMNSAVVERTGLSCDVDVPADYAELCAPERRPERCWTPLGTA